MFKIRLNYVGGWLRFTYINYNKMKIKNDKDIVEQFDQLEEVLEETNVG